MNKETNRQKHQGRRRGSLSETHTGKGREGERRGKGFLKMQEERVDTGEESKFNRRKISKAVEKDTLRTKERNGERKRL